MKHHHSQIFSGKTAPPILQSERPETRNGRMERPMQPQAVHVIPFDREESLDPMSKKFECLGQVEETFTSGPLLPLMINNQSRQARLR